MPELSVIVPVYNVEKYLQACIDSITNQVYPDFELILVDDGSTDQSGRICDEYARMDERILVIHQRNKGVSAARNAGIRKAKGSYIGFVDADDLLDPRMYDLLMRAARKSDADVVACGIGEFDSRTSVAAFNEDTSQIKYRSLGKKALIKDLFMKPGLLRRNCFNKVFKSDLVKGLRFSEEMKIWEDFEFLVQAYTSEYCERATFISPNLYYYRMTENSATHNSNSYSFKGREKQYRQKIYAALGKSEKKVKALAIEFFLDACIQHINWCKTKSGNKAEVFRVKRIIIKWIAYASIRGLLPRTSLNRYVREGIIGR